MEAKNVSELGAMMLVAVKDYFARSTAPLAARLATFEQKLAELPVPVDGAPGRDGVDGKDGQPGPAGERGEPGEQGPAGIAGERGAAGEPGPIGLTGERGPQGEAGPAGKDVSMKAVAGMVSSAVASAVAAIPVPKDGLPGEKGDPGRDGRDGKDGREGVDGINGVNGINGVDGKHGRDALHVDEFAAELRDDGRTISFRLSSGGKEFESEVKIAVPLDRGVYRAGVNYERGDFVSWDGSGWIAQKETTDKPGTSDHFRLATKRGRDGKDGKVEVAALVREPVRLK